MEGLHELLARWRDAEARGDAAALDALLDSEFRGDAPDGFVLDKRQWLARCRQSRAFEVGAVDVRVAHGTAIAMGIRADGCVCTVVAVRRGAGWAIVNLQRAADRPPTGAQISHLADVPRAPLRDLAGIASPTDKEQQMSQVIADMSMSLDGYVADPDDGINEVFGWMFSGEVEVPTATPGVAFRTSQASATVLREAMDNVGALISGRRNFDLAQGWGGNHPMGVPVFVVTHTVPDGWPREGSSMHFVTDGVESAVAQAKEAAGDKVVGVATPTITQQLLDAGLLDAIHVNLVPVLLGAGVPFFANLANAPVRLDGPEIVEGEGVTHLTYRVRR